MDERTAKGTQEAPSEAIALSSRRVGSFTAYCRTCASDQRLDARSIESTHRSAEGIVGYVRCQRGHLVIHRFAAAYPKPKPPQSVLDLRARLAGQPEGGATPAAGNF